MIPASRIALGTAQLGLPYGVANRTGQVGEADARAMLTRARAAGVDTLDTAISYGTSEAVLGAIGVDAFRVVTKLPGLPEGTTDVGGWVRQAVAGSLRRLGVGAVHAVLLHRPADLLGARGAELHRALLALRADGLASHLGISIYAPAELDALWPREGLDLVQAPFNVLDRRLAASGWLDRLAGDGVEVHTRSAFLQGLLLMPPAQLPVGLARFRPTLDAWAAWIADAGVPALAACLAFVLSHGAVARAVVGADGPGQLGEILRAAATPAPPVPPQLSSEDPDLIDPSRWKRP